MLSLQSTQQNEGILAKHANTDGKHENVLLWSLYGASLVEVGISRLHDCLPLHHYSPECH